MCPVGKGERLGTLIIALLNSCNALFLLPKKQSLRINQAILSLDLI